MCATAGQDFVGVTMCVMFCCISFLLSAGKLEAHIPWKNLTKEPIEITIDEVYVIVGPDLGVCLAVGSGCGLVVCLSEWVWLI